MVTPSDPGFGPMFGQFENLASDLFCHDLGDRMSKYKTDCRLFNGYKPCAYGNKCSGCDKFQRVGQRILLISLEAMGAVLRSTCLLEPIRRMHPDCHLTWLTMPASRPLLDENPLIDRVLVYNHETLPIIDRLEFDACYVVDKSMLAGSLGHRVNAMSKKGFGLSSQGFIEPLNSEALYQYDVGLSDQLKFFDNQKPETQQITESLGLSWNRDPYILEFNSDEQSQIGERRRRILNGHRGIIGFSTGCSTLYPYKKFTVGKSIEVVKGWRDRFPDHVVALYGGREDTDRNSEIYSAFTEDVMVVNTPTTEGLRSGLMWMHTADMMLSGCSLGLHIAIALKKKIVTWFGVSCSQEIDLYGLGVKLQSDVSCSPCWKRSCDKEPKCYERVSTETLMEATAEVLEQSS